MVLCCRHYCSLAIPILYSYFDGGDGKAKSLAFIRTLFIRPDLANYVRRLATYCDQNPKHDITYNRPKYSLDAELQGPKSALKKGCDDMSLREKWYEVFSYDRCYDDGRLDKLHGNWESITATLILLFPNISTLKIPEYRGNPDHNQPRFIPFVFAQALRLQNSIGSS